MKTAYLLPSGNYNITLSEEDLRKLLDKGYVSMTVGRTPCITHRAVWNPETKDLEPLDEKSVYNDLRFCLDENVADLEGGLWHIQFLCIGLEKGLCVPDRTETSFQEDLDFFVNDCTNAQLKVLYERVGEKLKEKESYPRTASNACEAMCMED